MRGTISRYITLLQELIPSGEWPAQLVHGDVGPGNIIFSGDRVVTIIDFTPHEATEVYALCQFFYWNFLWDADVGAAIDKIRSYTTFYSQCICNEVISDSALHAALVMAAGHRLLGPVYAMHSGTAEYVAAAIATRAELLDRVMAIQLS